MSADSLVFWHNPRCSKSRRALELLRARGVEPALVEYLKAPPSAAELRSVLARLGLPAAGILRRKEATALGVDPAAGEDALIAAMAANPALIERPIAFTSTRAALGRPPEAVLDLL